MLCGTELYIHLHHQLIPSTDIAVYLKQKPPTGLLCVEIKSGFFATVMVSHTVRYSEVYEHIALAHLLFFHCKGFLMNHTSQRAMLSLTVLPN